MHFGLTDRDGRPKPQLARARAVRAARPGAGGAGWEPIRGDAALLVPEHFERELPFTAPAYRRDIRAALLQGYVAAREADLPIALVRERDGIPGTARLVARAVGEAAHRRRARAAAELAQGGATVYLSYFAGSTAEPARAVAHRARRTVRRRHRLRYGLVDPIEDDES